jgi:adenylosuccinate lyase
MGAYPVTIEKEVDRYLQFLASTEILMTAVKAGVGRETAHDAIKRHAIAAGNGHATGRGFPSPFRPNWQMMRFSKMPASPRIKSMPF